MIVTKEEKSMSDHTNSLSSDHEETTSSQIKILETSRETETTPRAPTEDCDDEDDEDESGSSMNYNNTVENATNTAQQHTTTTKPVRFCEVSDVYKGYIEENRDTIEKTCELYTCTRELLYTTQTLSHFLTEDIQVHNICGLLIQETNKCWQKLEEERKTQEYAYHDDQEEGEEEDIYTCLENEVDQDELCRLQEQQQPCDSSEIKSSAEKLFNTKLRTLHCYCELVSPVSPDRSALIGGICGGALVVMMLLAVIAVLYIRQRKLKRRLQSEAQRSVNVMSPADDTFSTYEIVDDHFQGPNLWSGGMNSGHSSDHATPSLPPRDMPSQLPQTTSSGDRHSADPVPDIVFLSPGQGLPAPRGSSTSGSQGSLQDPPYELAVTGFEEHGRYSKLCFRHPSNSMAPEEVGDELQLRMSQSTASEEGEGQKQSNASEYADSTRL